jgi:hypothetical protein
MEHFMAAQGLQQNFVISAGEGASVVPESATQG